MTICVLADKPQRIRRVRIESVVVHMAAFCRITYLNRRLVRLRSLLLGAYLL